MVLPTGDALSALVYVDHNLGTVVKDAFVVPERLEDLAIKMGTLLDDPDQSLTRTDPARARAVMEAAIESGTQLHPPLTSESWPMCHPLVEWMLRMLPAGAALPERKEWTPEETAAVAAEFFESRFRPRSMTRTIAACWRACSGSALTMPPGIRGDGAR